MQKAIPLSFRCCLTRFAKTSSFRQGWLVDDRVLAAADNNARWCDQICRLHRIPTATEPGYWVARRRSQQTLRSISVAAPSDAKVQNHSVGPPIWDSCDGRPDTQGWSDVINAYQFTSAHSAAAVVAGAEASMKIAGWTLSSTSHSPLGPSAVWTKTVSGNVVARVLLGVGTRGPNKPSFWDFVGAAPPAGTRASGC